MKRNLLFLLVALLPMVASAYDAEIDGIFYNFSGDEAEVANGWYYETIVIPESVTYNGTTYAVTSIGKDAFRACVYLTSVIIPNSVTSIGDGAFYDCRALPSITIPSNVTTIGNDAFNCCYALSSITLPNSVISIGKRAFTSCRELTSIIIPDGVTSIEENTFNGCRALTSVIIPDNVTSIDYGAFYNCQALTSVIIPDGVTTIVEDVFFNCRSLSTVNIPSNVTTIGNTAFYNCIGLTSLSIGKGVTSIGRNAFKNCVNLTDVYSYAEEVPQTEGTVFTFNDGTPIVSATLHVPAGSIDKYKTTSPWSGFGSIEALPTPKILPFVQDGKVWTYASSNFIYDYEETCSLEGDTVISSRKCVKLYYTCQQYHQNHLYEGAMFEEGGNVYFIAPGSTTPALMYDFSSEPGTIITVGPYELRINEKKLAKYRGEYLKIIDYSPLEDEYGEYEWIDGLGIDCGGLLTDIVEGTAWRTGGERYLKTCSINGEVVYDEDDFYTSAQIVNENEVNYATDQMATIVLPTEPDASKGKYYRLDRCEEGQIIFEQELQPQAHIPYIIVPSEDFSIDTSTLDLAGLSNDTVSIGGISFIGSYSSETLKEPEGSYIDIIDTTPDCGFSTTAETGKKAYIGALRAYLQVSRDEPYNHGGSKAPGEKLGILLKDYGTSIGEIHNSQFIRGRLKSEPIRVR